MFERFEHIIKLKLATQCKFLCPPSQKCRCQGTDYFHRARCCRLFNRRQVTSAIYGRSFCRDLDAFSVSVWCGFWEEPRTAISSTVCVRPWEEPELWIVFQSIDSLIEMSPTKSVKITFRFLSSRRKASAHSPRPHEKLQSLFMTLRQSGEAFPLKGTRMRNLGVAWSCARNRIDMMLTPWCHTKMRNLEREIDKVAILKIGAACVRFPGGGRGSPERGQWTESFG